MRRKYVWSPEANALVEVPTTWTQPVAPTVVPDLPGYHSPVTGEWIEGRKARREDLKRTGSRPWEGREAEQKEADRQKAYEEKRNDHKLDEAARRAFYQLSPQQRRALERG